MRELAYRSREFADEIVGLITNCLTLSEQAGDILHRLAPNSEKTSELVQEIHSTSQEELMGAEHINQAIQQLDIVTQNTASTAEEVSTSAETQAAQSEHLQQCMSFFTVKESEPTPPHNDRERLDLLGSFKKDRLIELLTHALTHDQKTETPPLPAADDVSAPEQPPTEVTLHLETRKKTPDALDGDFEHY